MKERVGIVTIRDGVTPKGKKFWALMYRCPAAYPGDPNKGRLIRRRINQEGTSLEEVRAMADNLSRQAYEGRGYLQAEQPTTPTIAKGIATAIRLANTTRQVEKERSRHGAKFVLWLGQKHPEVKIWQDMRPSILAEYVVDLEKDGKAPATVTLAIAPVKLAWRRMFEDFPDLVRPLPRIKQKAKPPTEMQTLKPAEVVALLDWLKQNRTDLWPIACLQALAGLRGLEAAALRRQDIDLDEGKLLIRSTEHHELKNAASHRTIFVCKEVVDALKARIKAQKIIPPGGELFVNKSGNLWTKDALVLRWTRLRKTAAKDTGLTALRTMQAHRLRSFFATTAARLGVNDRVIQFYIGHAPADTLGSFYLKIAEEELKAVATTMDNWRSLTNSEAKANPSEPTGKNTATSV